MDRYKQIFKEDKEVDKAINALQYIMQRHSGNVKQAKETMAKIKKLFGKDSEVYSYLKKFGDPDESGQYNKVKDKWDVYAKSLMKKKEESLQEESNFTAQRKAKLNIPLIMSEEGLYDVFLGPYRNKEGYFHLIIYQGRSMKPYVNYIYPTMVKAGEAIDKFVGNIKEYKARRDKAKADSKVQAKTVFDEIKPGDIFNTSWGYDQTNVDFYQVIEKRGNSSVVLREIAGEMVPSSGYSTMAGMIKPVKDKFTGTAFVARVTPYGIKVGRQTASPYTGGDDGTYVSWYA